MNLIQFKTHLQLRPSFTCSLCLLHRLYVNTVTAAGSNNLWWKLSFRQLLVVLLFSTNENYNYISLHNLDLTEFLQGGDPKLLIMIFRQRGSAFPHYLSSDGLRRHLHRVHTTDESLEPLVGEGRLTPI